MTPSKVLPLPKTPKTYNGELLGPDGVFQKPLEITRKAAIDALVSKGMTIVRSDSFTIEAERAPTDAEIISEFERTQSAFWTLGRSIEQGPFKVVREPDGSAIIGRADGTPLYKVHGNTKRGCGIRLKPLGQTNTGVYLTYCTDAGEIIVEMERVLGKSVKAK